MEMKTINELIDAKMLRIQEDQDRLANQWSPLINVVNEYLQETEGREMTLYERRNVSQCLENALTETGLKSKRRLLFEATTEDNISFLGVQLPVIAALLPSLVLNDLVNVQALDRRIGAVFYLDVRYGSTKGAISAGEDMMNAKTGHDRTIAGRRYASTMVVDEAIESTGGASSITGTLDYAPGVDVTSGTIVVKDEDGTEIGNDTVTAGTITGTNCIGTVEADGSYSLTAVTSWDSGGITVSYEYQYDKPYNASTGDYYGVPEADINVSQESITAKDFPLKSKYSVGAAMDLLKAHGINLENELVKYLGSEIRFTIDHYGIDMIDDASINGVVVAGATQTPAAAIGAWDASVGSGQQWVWTKHDILNQFEKGNNNIIAKTLRALASWIVAGNNVARVIRQLPGFKPVANLNKTPPTGPHKIGTLDGRLVVQDPLLATRTISGSSIAGADRYIMGWKGTNYLDSAFIYAPYIPLFATPTLVTADLFAQKGFLSSAGFKHINVGMFTYGRITNLA